MILFFKTIQYLIISQLSAIFKHWTSSITILRTRHTTILIFKVLRHITPYLIFRFKAVCRSVAYSDFGISGPSKAPTPISNKNSNSLATRSALSRASDNLENQVLFLNTHQIFLIVKCKLSELLMKFYRLHEEPDHYTLIGEPNPCCTAGKQRTGTTFYRI